MRRKGIVTRFNLFLVLLLVALPIIGACAPASAPGAASETKPVTLKAVSFLPKQNETVSGVPIFIEEVKKATKGEVTIDWVGGPEIIPALELAEAVRTGVIDMAFLPASHYTPLVPQSETLSLSMLSPMEERSVGYYDRMVEFNKSANFHYLGRAIPHPGFYLWTTKKRIQSIGDLKGLRMRTAVLYNEMMQDMGMVPVTIAAPETYTALERGTVDGFGWPVSGVVSEGWAEVTKYMIDHPFYKSNGVAIVNLDVWNKLPAPLRDIVQKATIDAEPKLVDHFLAIENSERQKLKNAGVEFIKLPAAEAERYIKIAYDAKWKKLEAAPGYDAGLRKLITK